MLFRSLIIKLIDQVFLRNDFIILRRFAHAAAPVINLVGIEEFVFEMSSFQYLIFHIEFHTF